MNDKAPALDSDLYDFMRTGQRREAFPEVRFVEFTPPEDSGPASTTIVAEEGMGESLVDGPAWLGVARNPSPHDFARGTDTTFGLPRQLADR